MRSADGDARQGLRQCLLFLFARRVLSKEGKQAAPTGFLPLAARRASDSHIERFLRAIASEAARRIVSGPRERREYSFVSVGMRERRHAVVSEQAASAGASRCRERAISRALQRRFGFSRRIARGGRLPARSVSNAQGGNASYTLPQPFRLLKEIAMLSSGVCAVQRSCSTM
jgi:nitroreductase